jgi:NitT/TauT family transport system permease protein
MSRIYRIAPHAGFVILTALILSPSLVEIENKWFFLAIVVMIEARLIASHKSKSAHDIALIVYLFLIAWEFSTTKVLIANNLLVPVPEKVFAVIISDWKTILTGIGASLNLLFISMFFALVLAIGLGIVVGWFKRIRSSLLPIAKVISPIPPIIYSPYAVGLFPTFKAASLFIVFSSIFWPLFINMIITVSTIDRRIMESAKTINTRTKAIFFQILFPYSLPKVLDGMNVTLSGAFMTLTAAEMLGAKSGVGRYVRYNADYANYTKVVAGIIVIGVVITLLNKLLVIAQTSLIKWR